MEIDRGKVGARADKLLCVLEVLKDSVTAYLGHEKYAEDAFEALEEGLFAIASSTKAFKNATQALDDVLYIETSWTEDQEDDL